MTPRAGIRTDLRDADWLVRPATRAVFDALSVSGFEVRAVGGAVRNALIGKAVADVDLATNAAPDEVIAAVTRAKLRAIPTGLDHGTVTVVSDHIAHEVTTLREDTETDGRRAKVAFTADWAADARRRDFTINALYCDRDGVIYDPLGGLPDLAAGRVRFIGDPHARIREDYLRVLRFFRFTAEYAGGVADRDGLTACNAERSGLARLSAERVRSEFLRLLTAPDALRMITTMLHHGYLPDLLGVAPNLAVLARVAGIEDLRGQTADATLRLAGLGVIVPEDAERLGARLRFGNAEIARLRASAHWTGDTTALPMDAAVREMVYRHGRSDACDHLCLAWARSGAALDDAAWRAALDLSHHWQAPAFPLTGNDALAAGLVPGPVIGATLAALETAWVETGFTRCRAQLLADLTALVDKHKSVALGH